MTVHRDREGEYICCGGRGGQEEASCNKTIPTPKKAPVIFLKLSQNIQLKVMFVTHLKYSQLNSILYQNLTVQHRT